MARLRPASSYQHPRAPIRLIAQKGKRPLRNAVAQALAHLGDDFDKRKALHLLQNGMVHAIAREAIDWTHYREILKAVFDKWWMIADAGSALGTRKINGAFSQKRRGVRFGKAHDDETGLQHAYAVLDGIQVRKDIGNRFNFDRFDPVTIAALRATQDALIADLSLQVRDTIQAVIEHGQMLGMSPAALVDEIESVIGLTANQATAVMNYEAMVRGLNPNALARQLRDLNLDDTISEAIRIGLPLDEATIQHAVSAYEANYLQYRAETIAFTESVRAANFGLDEAYRQAIDRGALPDEAVKKFWKTSLLENVCPVCLSIPDMNPEGVGMQENFQSVDGPKKIPPIHVRCACSLEYITDLDKVPDDNVQEIAA